MASMGRAVVHVIAACVLAGVAFAPGGSPSLARADAPTSATGHVRFVCPRGPPPNCALGPNTTEYSFSAVDQPNGGVGGEIQFQIHRAIGQVLEGHATTVCVTVVGNVARIGAFVDRFTVDKVEDTEFQSLLITVQDNGEGADDPPDEASVVFFGHTQGAAYTHCATGFAQPRFPITLGNVQVRPGS
jgi:hypothetical protein